jgi:hypothetical protein
VRRGTDDDADAVGRLLHDFNREFGEPTPPPSELADRIRLLLGDGDTLVLLAGPGPDGIAVLRFRRLWGADTMEIGVDAPDAAARSLYESLGFTNRVGGPGGPVMFVYEREL